MDIHVRKNPSSTEVNLITAGLKGFNKEFGTEDCHNQIGIFAKDDSGRTVGGAVCSFQYTSCYIHLFWLEAGSRGKGQGRAVFEALVHECKEYGVKDIFLDTFSFQSSGFYERLGFECVGCLSNFPKQGISKRFYHATIS